MENVTMILNLVIIQHVGDSVRNIAKYITLIASWEYKLD